MHVESVFAQKLAAAGSMALLVARTEVLTDERSAASVQVTILCSGWLYLWQSGKSQL